MKLLGYYLIEPDRKNMQALSIPSECIYSVSPCFCDQFPDLSSFWGNEQQKSAFAEKMKIDDQTLDHLNSLLTYCYSIPGAYFTDPDAARVFLRLFRDAGYDLRMLSLYFNEEDHAKAIEILRGTVNFSCIENSLDSEQGEIIGKEIIGYDIASYHSWICNYLHLDKYPIQPKFNKFGLLDNPWSEVEELAQRCQDQGDPVIWMPCLIKEHK